MPTNSKIQEETEDKDWREKRFYVMQTLENNKKLLVDHGNQINDFKITLGHIDANITKLNDKFDDNISQIKKLIESDKSSKKENMTAWVKFACEIFKILATAIVTLTTLIATGLLDIIKLKLS